MRLKRVWMGLTIAGFWHHSNWFYVPEDRFGDDGTWDCRDEDFDMVSADLYGGVVFAQSTQTYEEAFRFFVTHGFQFLQIIQAAPGMEGGLRVYRLK